MKKIIFIIILISSSFSLMAHEGGHGNPLKEWTLKSNSKTFNADFIKYEKNQVWLSDQSHQIRKFNISDLSVKDQQYVKAKQEVILTINSKKENTTGYASFMSSKSWFLFLGGILLLFSAFQFFKQKKMIYSVYGVLGALIISLASCSSNDDTAEIESEEEVEEEVEEEEVEMPVTGETLDVPANDTTFLQSIFESFAEVTTSSDDTYFYIASNGLPNHNMMVGITNWQQQVPINVDYTGTNSWAIPIQPKLAENPLSTVDNLLKGAIAIAANGIPIFNPLNNRGEDANLIGELDQWGGHCGRADDYHYHLPPTHLQETVGEGMPIAYAVDGFPLYGETTEELDESLGKLNEDGSYQYHAVPDYPYLIASMRGEVTLDPNTIAPENQVIPQAMTRGVRPALEPLRDAEITAFEKNNESSYSLTYRIELEEYMVNYSWDEAGLYTYEFVNPDGTITTETYQK